MQKVSHRNLHLPLGASMEDSTTSLLGELGTKEVHGV